MCGIAGIFDTLSNRIQDAAVLQRMNDSQRHRGPDEGSLHLEPGIGLGHVRDGKLRLLAVGSPERSALFPDTPTVAEVGLKGFDADSWFGFYAPAGVDKAIVDRMNQEVNKALALPTVRNRIAELGGVASPMSPAEFADKAKADFERFGSVIRERGISVQ